MMLILSVHSLMSIFLFFALFWSLMAIVILGNLGECLDSAPHVWGLNFAIVCVHSLMILAIVVLWLMSVIHLLHCCGILNFRSTVNFSRAFVHVHSSHRKLLVVLGRHGSRILSIDTVLNCTFNHS
jgi:hypothetical protein